MMIKRVATSVALWSLLFSPGCSSAPDDQPQVASVRGLITVDGQPRENLLITFTPEKGRPSTGTTNANGEYTLNYLRDIQGAMIGKHTVQITTINVSTSDTQPQQEAFKEPIPAQYNTQSTLKADVAAGDNTLNFDLKTK